MALMTGACNLHTGYQDGEYQGFLITQQQEQYGTTALHIWAAYSEGLNLLEVTMAQIREWAKAINADRITFSSSRRGWARTGMKLGFEPTMTIYEMTL